MSEEEQEWHPDGCDVHWSLGTALVVMILAIAGLLLYLAFHLTA